WLKEYLVLNKEIDEETFIKNLLKIIKKIDNTSEIKFDETVKIDFEKNYFEKFRDFEIRENQKIMATSVIESLENNKKIIIEAPTGVGKTFAYLLPSILYSVKSGEKVFISTSSKALQDQIIYKDLDFFAKNLEVPFSFCKLKGRRNYISVFQLFSTLHQNTFLSLDEVGFFSKIFLWLFDTIDGELDELNFYPGEFNLLRQISADSSFVLKEQNPYKSYEFIIKARTKAQKSNIIIINHSLLLNDLVNDNAIFGNISNLIVDEAHNLEDTATDSFKKIVNTKTIEDNLSFIEKIQAKPNNSIKDFYTLKDSILLNFNMIFENFESYFYKLQFGNQNREFLIQKDFFKDFSDIEILLKNIESKFENLFKNALDLEDKVFASIEMEISIIKEIIESLKIILNSDEISNGKYIKVVGLNDRNGFYVYHTLLNPGDYLKENLWYKLDSCILTSATLKIGEDFSYIEKILSLKDIFSSLSLESDFDYSKQALLFIPNNLGNIKYNNTSQILSFLEKLFKIVKGRSLVLFTSYQTIKDAYVGLNNPLKKEGINIYAQNIGGSKHKLLEQFKKSRESSLLFGTDSFWEGVDIAGKDLETLIIYKFPFLPPNDPIFLARSKLFADSFSDYSIPKAIIKLKQGFGRLIRTKNDKGIVILLDNRIFSTNWGEKMFLAFPKNLNIKIGDNESFLNLLENKKGV
ncbi:MAG: helicase C-terminal domain-containing protein, partial [Candidatus Gracilibacteria bacterium]|nr:helicase C-terminal domain-containing protein [Candidatus Gracilibacteria bacterium]